MADTDSQPAKEVKAPGKGLAFWLIFVALCVSLFLSALEFSVVGNALPVIIQDLKGSEFTWIGNAYALSATAFLPMSGVAAEMFGRKVSFIAALLIFTLGCALCGAAQSMAWLIGARTVQGIGGGAIQSISTIIVSDMVSLQERGKYNGFLGMTWGVATAIGPLIGGSLAQQGQWRWIFYLNLPICGLALALVLVFMKLPTPPGTFREKISKMDWVGNFLIISTTTSLVIALTWGGSRYPWNSARVLVPLIIGVVGLLLSIFVYEFFIASHPMIPRTLLSNRTTVSGYFQVFINSLVVIVWVYYLPVYFQGCKDASPTRSSVDLFGITFLTGPFTVLAGISVSITKKYRPQHWVAWVLALAGAGSFISFHADTNLAQVIGLTTLGAAGAGMLFGITYFPVLSPLPLPETARALSLFAFIRALAQIWGITIGGTILTNGLRKNLPASFLSESAGGVDLAYSVIPQVRGLSEPLKTQVRNAFAESLRPVWYTLTAVTAAALISALLMADVPMRDTVDKKWAMEQPKNKDVEQSANEKEGEAGSV